MDWYLNEPLETQDTGYRGRTHYARAELVGARMEAIKERERREEAEADALRVGVRLEALDQLLAQLKPGQAVIDKEKLQNRD
ncbi:MULTISPECIES: hypothetical protein [Pseudomonas aeruginosa group]|nr:hypothetical protein [Pseudomonas aeruginosa]MCW8021437.1 hypothetical protein [Pseudomonas aeruginosa]